MKDRDKLAPGKYGLYILGSELEKILGEDSVPVEKIEGLLDGEVVPLSEDQAMIIALAHLMGHFAVDLYSNED